MVADKRARTPDASSSSDSPVDEATARSRRLLTAARAVIGVTLLGQLALLIQRSWAQYDAGAVSMDFAIFHQAWQQIGSGNLNPTSTIIDLPYWKSHFEVVMWPLALLHPIFPSGVTLLIVQDLAIVGAEAIAVLWVLEVVQRGRTLRPWHLVPVATVLLLLVTNERISVVAKSDFHFQALATMFLLGGARALWRGETRRAWPWLVAALLTGDVAGTYVAGLGLSALVARRDTRRAGAALIATGAAWVLLIGALGANHGSAIGGYQHLVDEPLPASGGALLVVVTALVLHPSRPLEVLGSKLGLFGAEFAATGFVGMFHPWTFGVTAVVVVSGGLQESLAFFVPFQNFPAIVFVTVGTAMTMDWGLRCSRVGARRPVLARATVAVGFAAAAAVVVLVGRAPEGAPHPEPPSAAAALAAVDARLRPDDQVIASFGLVGRYAGREHVRRFLVPARLPVEADRVVFVFSPTVGNMPTPGVQEAAAARVLELGAEQIVDTPDVQAFVWFPPEGTTTIGLPTELLAGS
ncbi:Predicted membrane protein [Blastococcus fimeti]|nr:Predicted membrane protein [Blastococcus fimeti]